MTKEYQKRCSSVNEL